MQLDQSDIKSLAKKREVPYEVMFKISDAQQDPIKKNRYWFDFPSQWANQLDKDPIIGIRDMYLTKVNRKILFWLSITICDKNDSSILWLTRTRKIGFYLNSFDTINDFIDKFNTNYVSILTPYEEDATTTNQNFESMNLETTNHNWTDIFKANYMYDYGNKEAKLLFGVKYEYSGTTLTVTDKQMLPMKLSLESLLNLLILILEHYLELIRK